MRLFIFSIVVLAIIIAGIICNTLYMDNLTNKMLDLIDNLPANADFNGDNTQIEELFDLWHSNIQYVALNAVSTYITDITAAIIDVQYYYQSDFDMLYKSACEHLYQAVLRLHELERFSIDNII